MAYKGSTELSSVANPPRLLFGGGMWNKRSSDVVGSSQLVGQQVWLYNSTNSSTDLCGANFFTDAKQLGMQEGDIIMGAFTTGSSMAFYAGVIGPVSTAGAAIASSGAQLRSQ